MSALFVLVLGSESASGQTYAPRPSGNEIPYPFYRFKLWGDLSPGTQRRAEALGYEETTWNLPGTAVVEGLPWDSLDPTQQVQAVSFGFNEPVWDCYINHYRGFTWDQLVQMEVGGYYAVLGYTPSSWENGEVPATFDLDFSQLSASQRGAAIALCFDNANIWDMLSLEDWSEVPVSPAPTKRPTASPTETSSSSPSKAPTPMPTDRPTTVAPSPMPTTLRPTESTFPPFNVATDAPSSNPSSRTDTGSVSKSIEQEDGAFSFYLNTVFIGAASAAYLLMM